MKRIGIVSVFFLGVVLCSGIVAFTQGPPRGPGMPEGGPKQLACEQVSERDFQRAVQEAYERGFNQGFRAGLGSRNELRRDAPKGERFDRKEPRRDGPPRDFRGPGPQGRSFEGREGRGERPQRGFHEFDRRGPDFHGERMHRRDFRHADGPQGDFRGPGPRAGRFEGRNFRDDHSQRGFDQHGPDRRGERGHRGGFGPRPDGPPERNEPDDRPPGPSADL